MASSPVGSNSLILEVLNRNNYKDWRPRVKTYLLAEDLWEVVEAITEPAKLEDDKALYKAWRKKNAKALYAIQNSCGTEMFSFIREIELAKSAWKALEQECKVVQGYDENNADHVELYISFTQLVSSGDWDKAKECLGEVDVRSIARAKHPRDYSGDIALHVAARQGHIHIVKELVVLMTPDDLKTKNANGFTALHIAVKEGHAHIVKELVLFMSREDLKIKNNDGYTALHLAVNKGNMPIVKEFVTKEEGENNISEDNFRLYKPFRNYVNEGDWDNANKCLTELDDPCSAVTVVYPRDGYGDTALHVAAGKGHVDILKQLVLLLKERQELDLELKTAQDFTAFGSGINLGVSEQVVMERAKYMVEQYEKTLTSILEVQNAEGSTALHLAVLNGCVDIVKELVLFMRQEGLEIKDVDGDSPLQKAIRHGKVDIVKELVPLMRQEALDEKDYEGYTALGLALDVSKDEDAMAIAKFMARKNNKVVVIPTAPENDIPIICAVRASKWKLARYLYTVTPLEVLNGIDGSRFICLCLNTSKTLDLAWDLLQCFPNLAFTITEAHKTSPMLRLASMGYTFLSGTRLTFWQRWIYD